MATRILIVDDDQKTCEAISLLLPFQDYAVTTASGAYALAAVYFGEPDIVLTEVVMSDKCGIELIKEIKRANSNIKIIATSAGGALDVGYILELAGKLGADRVLPKPFKIDQLLAAIEQIIELPSAPTAGAPSDA